MRVLTPAARLLRSLTTLERLLLLVTIFGVALHLSLFWLGRVLWDGATYAYMGGSFARNGAIAVDWDPSGAFPVWELGILYPIYLAAFYGVAGFSVAVTKVAALGASLAVIAVGYWTTKNLFDRPRGLVVAALLAVDPTLLRTNYLNYAEPFTLIFFIAAFWALVKAVSDPRYMLLFGLFAGMFYMSKSIIGWSFMVGGAVALLGWRWYHVRSRLVRDKYWIAGILVLLAFVALREAMIEAHGRVVLTHSLSFGLSQLGAFLPMLALKLPFLVLLLSVFAIFWLPELRKALRSAKEPVHNVLLLGIAAVAAATWLFIAMIGVTEPDNPVFWQDNMRYVVILMVPLLWVAFHHSDIRAEYRRWDWRPTIGRRNILMFVVVGAVAAVVLLVVGLWLAVFVGFGAIATLYPSPRKRLALMLTVFVLTGTNAITLVDQPAFIEATAALNSRLRPGDVVALDRQVPPNLNAVQLYSYVAVRDIDVITYEDGGGATFIMSQVRPGASLTYDGYTRIGTFTSISQRTALSRLVSGFVGSDSETVPHVVNLWQLNSTLGR